jgi:hypothetical protein
MTVITKIEHEENICLISEKRIKILACNEFCGAALVVTEMLINML